MDVVSTILAAAKAVGVSGSLLVAVCAHESGGFKQNYSPMDKGSPSYGSCQIKQATAAMFGFKGDPSKLNNPKTNALYAAKYMKYQQNRYGDSWVKLTSAYNAGSFFESRIIVGCPKNLGYVRKVQKRLPLELQGRLDCGSFGELADNP